MSAGDYEFVEGASSDLCFAARGETLEALFSACAEALLAACVADPGSVLVRERIPVRLAEPDLDLLLLRFLSELVFLRDARGLLLRAGRLEVQAEGPTAALEGELAGERIDPARHALEHDVKAVTAHGLSIERAQGLYRVRVTLDV